MLFWLICALLTVAVTVLALRPLLSGRRGASTRDSEHDLQVYKDQLDEVDRELERGVIGQDEADAARIEISRRILSASEAVAGGAGDATSPKRRSFAFSLAASFVVVSSLAVYLIVGSPGYPGRPFAERASTPANMASVADLIARVEARLREVPDDGQGWEVLAPVYAKQGRHEDAIRAYARAMELLGQNRARLRGFAEAHLALSNGIVVSEARDAFRKILAKEPELVAPRFWLAVGLEQDGKREAAKAAYEKVLVDARAQVAKGEIPPRVAKIIEERLAAVGGEVAATPSGGGEGERTPAAGEAAGDDEARAAIAKLPDEERARMIENMVAGLAERLESEGGERGEWERLIRSYWVLGRKKAARDALEAARRQFTEDATELAALDTFARNLGVVP
jgi:cytochrome c-type biogenesis protein CcmH